MKGGQKRGGACMNFKKKSLKEDLTVGSCLVGALAVNTRALWEDSGERGKRVVGQMSVSGVTTVNTYHARHWWLAVSIGRKQVQEHANKFVPAEKIGRRKLSMDWMCRQKPSCWK
jgi:hypothetical protein